MVRQQVPNASDYFEQVDATAALRQGDVFASVPFLLGDSVDDFISERELERVLASSEPERAEIVAASSITVIGSEPVEQARMAGPMSFVHAILVSADSYLAWVARRGGPAAVTLMPIETIASLSSIEGDLPEGDLSGGDLQDFDDLLYYMRLPGIPDTQIAESVVRLTLAFSIDVRMILSHRIARLSGVGRQQLRRKLSNFFSGVERWRGEFPP